MVKVTKEAADYREATPGPRHEHCGSCLAMKEDGTCDRVLGHVVRRYVCDLYHPRPRAGVAPAALPQ